VAEGGLESLALHRLASDLGYRTGALYRYFDGKDALVLALLERAVDAIASRVRAGMAAADAAIGRRPAAGERALGRIVAASRAYLEAEPHHAALVARMLADPRPVVSDLASGTRALPAALGVIVELVACFAEARAARVLRRGNDAQRVSLLWSSLQGLSTARKMARFGVAGDFDRLGAPLVRALLCGFGADPAILDAAIHRTFREVKR